MSQFVRKLIYHENESSLQVLDEKTNKNPVLDLILQEAVAAAAHMQKADPTRSLRLPRNKLFIMEKRGKRLSQSGPGRRRDRGLKIDLPCQELKVDYFPHAGWRDELSWKASPKISSSLLLLFLRRPHIEQGEEQEEKPGKTHTVFWILCDI